MVKSSTPAYRLPTRLPWLPRKSHPAPGCSSCWGWSGWTASRSRSAGPAPRSGTARQRRPPPASSGGRCGKTSWSRCRCSQTPAAGPDSPPPAGPAPPNRRRRWRCRSPPDPGAAAPRPAGSSGARRYRDRDAPNLQLGGQLRRGLGPAAHRLLVHLAGGAQVHKIQGAGGQLGHRIARHHVLDHPPAGEPLHPAVELNKQMVPVQVAVYRAHPPH